jgi:hypothetical protein
MLRSNKGDVEKSCAGRPAADRRRAGRRTAQSRENYCQVIDMMLIFCSDLFKG